MNGLELSREYFEQYGRPMLQEQFSDVMPSLAAGLFGSGSECYGYDDEVSRDHDFEPGFCLMLPGEEVVDRKTAFALERAYARLPKEYQGYARSAVSPVGGSRHGVLRTADFFLEKTGSPDGCLDMHAWLSLPEHALAEAVNGTLFMDELGEVTAIRARISYYPEQIRLKKLASHLLMMAQSGQYNYLRCLRHEETGAAQLCVVEFVKNAMSVIFLLNRVYQPFYKWSFRAMRSLPKLDLSVPLLEYLLTTDNTGEMAEEKYEVMEGIAADVIDELQEQELTKAICQDLEKHAYSVNDGIADATLRNLHILAAL